MGILNLANAVLATICLVLAIHALVNNHIGWMLCLVTAMVLNIAVILWGSL